MKLTVGKLLDSVHIKIGFKSDPEVRNWIDTPTTDCNKD